MLPELITGGGMVSASIIAWKVHRAICQNLIVTWHEKLESEIVDRRHIEGELAHLASFAENAPTPIIEIVGGENIAYANESARLIFPSLDAHNKECPLFAGLPALAEKMRAEGQSLCSRPIEIAGRIYDERICLLGNGRLHLYLSDITELKRLDQLKTDFVNMTSHELRTPLTSILGMVKIVTSGMAGSINDIQHESLSIALRNIERLSRLINDLLDVSKIEAGNMELTLEPVKMMELAQQLADTFRALLQERHLELRVRVQPEHLTIRADRDRIIQIFTNFIHNAIKFTRQGFIDLTLEENATQVRCTVADTGPGISPSDLPRLFGKFQQTHTQAANGEKGTGLGLSLCKGLIELHGGKVWVESEVGKGTKFIFTLPSAGAVHSQSHTPN